MALNMPRVMILVSWFHLACIIQLVFMMSMIPTRNNYQRGFRLYTCPCHMIRCWNERSELNIPQVDKFIIRAFTWHLNIHLGIFCRFILNMVLNTTAYKGLYKKIFLGVMETEKCWVVRVRPTIKRDKNDLQTNHCL